MRIKFPLNKKRTQLGLISEPVIPIHVLTKYGYQQFDFLVDTGADCSIMPASVAVDLNMDIMKLPRIHFTGIECGNVVAYMTKINVKITGTPIDLTCALSSQEKTPFILGRKDLFEKFNILFDNKNELIKFIRF